MAESEDKSDDKSDDKADKPTDEDVKGEAAGKADDAEADKTEAEASEAAAEKAPEKADELDDAGEGYILDPEINREIENRERSLAEQAAELFGLEAPVGHRGDQTLTVPKTRIVEVLTELKTNSRFGFTQLIDVTAVDNLKRDEVESRFTVVYHLNSPERNARLRIHVPVEEEDPSLPTAARIFKAANWGERECFDMFGIDFKGHPDLRRILMPVDFGSHPLRKDYPLRGRGERDDFPRLRRGQMEDV